MRSFSINRRRVSLLGLATFCAVVAVIVVPHRLSTTTTQITLQTGAKMQVQVSLRSPWGWTTPTCLADMKVLIDGKVVPLPGEALANLQPLDPARQPFISERGGFPELIVWGVRGSSLIEVRWRFLNYSLSERDVLKKGNQDRIYFVPPGLAYKQVVLPPLSGIQMVAMAPEKFAKPSHKELSK